MIIVLLVSGIYAVYYWSPRPQRGPRAATVSPPLEFAIEIDKTEYQRSENVSVLLTLTNISNETISVSWASHYIGLRKPTNGSLSYSILYTNGTAAFNWSERLARAQEYLEVTLKAGDSIVAVFIWEQYVRTQEGPLPYMKAPNATYGVRGYTDEMGLTMYGETSSVALETPTINFAIA